MAMKSASNTRKLQIVFVALLVVASAQVLWWVLDQGRSSSATKTRTEQLYEADRNAVSRLPVEQRQGLVEHFPHLELADGEVVIRPQAREALERARESRMNQYAWEGGFFLAVLLAGIFVLWRALNRASELRDKQEDFIAAVSHEFKSPLASLRLTAETLKRRNAVQDEGHGWVDRMLGDIGRLEGMVSNILEAARFEKGSVEPVRQPVLLGRVVDSVMDRLKARFEEAEVQVERVIPEGFELHVDAVGLQTIVRNLLENAMHATAAAQGRPGHVESLVRIEASHSSGKASLRVIDNGIGFDPLEGPKLFERFYRVGPEMRRTMPGTGLGLSIVERYVELENGRITATSLGPGKGATFVVEWPLEGHSSLEGKR